MSIAVRRIDAHAWTPPYAQAQINPVTQVNTNGRGAVVYLPVTPPDTRAAAGSGGAMPVTPRPPKLMMDPTDRTTWQRPYRFT